MKNLILSLLFLFVLCIPVIAAETPARNITATTTSFSKCLTSIDNNVQQALNDIDACFGSAGTYTFMDSLVNNQGYVTLVNDTSTPLTSEYYGWNASGVEGFFPLPSSMIYPGAGIAVSTGSGWTTSIATNYFYPASNPSSYTTLAAVAAVGYVTGMPWTSAGYLTGVTTDASLTGAGTSVSHLGVNWQDFTQGNLSGVNWSAFYPTSNPSGYITNAGINWSAFPNTQGYLNTINWAGLTTANGTGVNWQSFYPTSNPFSFLTAVPWGSGTTGNMTGINWSSFYPTSNPLGWLTSWTSGTTTNMTGINWQSFFPTASMGSTNWSDYDLLSKNQTIAGNKTFSNTITGSISGNAATATNISTNGTANQVWGMNAGASAQGWQTATGGGSGTVSSVSASNASAIVTPTTGAVGVSVNWQDFKVFADSGVNWSDIQTLSTAQTIQGLKTFKGGITGKNNGALNSVTINCSGARIAGTSLFSSYSSPYRFPTNGTITAAYIEGSYIGNSASISIDVWKANASLPSSLNIISGSNPLVLSLQTYNNNSLSGWTTSVSAGDVFTCFIENNFPTCDSVTATLVITE